MQITVVNGSPRGSRGNTPFMVREFSAGMGESGASLETVFLVEKDINDCRGCFACWISSPGRCIIEDDMRGLLDQFLSSDIVVFVTPVYVDNVTGIMKTFMDRLIPGMEPFFDKDDGGECRHPPRRGKYPKIVVISNCGFPEQSLFQVLRASV